ncbi:MAG: DUF2752 domain-containing protein [Nitrospirae bacterium]|nr:DUF2752 domain-containing protein [Nitrospirota bacterium]
MEISSRKGTESPVMEYSLIYGGLAILILLAARFLPLAKMPIFCPLKTVSGIPCPTCGSTRAIIHLAHFDLMGAFAMNPLISSSLIAGTIFLLYSLASYLLTPLRLDVKFSLREKLILRLGIGLAIFLNWIYLIISGI